MMTRAEQQLRLDTLNRNLAEGSIGVVAKTLIAVAVGVAVLVAFQVFAFASAATSVAGR